MMRLGLIGCGAVASRFHIPAIRGIPEIGLEAVADIDASHAKEFAKQHRIKRAYSDHLEMLDDCSLDAILVCTPPETHRRMVLDSIKCRRHVMCEKPFTSSVDDARTIAEQETDVAVFPAHNYIFTPSLGVAREMMTAQRLGELKSIRAEIAVGFWSWRSRTEYRKAEQSGVIADLLYHVAYVVSYLAHIDHVTEVWTHRGDSGVIDRVQVKATLKNDAEATLSAHWRSVIPSFRVVLTHVSGEIRLELMKRPHTVWVKERDGVSKVRLSDNGVGFRSLVRGRHPSFVLEHMSFLRSAMLGADQEVTAQEAVETLRILDEIETMAGV